MVYIAQYLNHLQKKYKCETNKIDKADSNHKIYKTYDLESNHKADKIYKPDKIHKSDSNHKVDKTYKLNSNQKIDKTYELDSNYKVNKVNSGKPNNLNLSAFLLLLS